MSSLALMQTDTGMALLLTVVVLVLLGMVFYFHRDPSSKFDLRDLICYRGELNQGKFMRFGAWIISTWGFVYLVLDQKLTEWYFAGYMAAWAGNALISKYLDRGRASDAEPTATQEPVEPPPPPRRRTSVK
jgi:hypothetical protein